MWKEESDEINEINQHIIQCKKWDVIVSEQFEILLNVSLCIRFDEKINNWGINLGTHIC